MQLKQLRREVAELLKQGKQGNARIRVEAVIRENLTLQAYDIIELFLELVSVRVPLMEKAKEMPPDMMEAICSLIYAGDRMSTDLPELAVIRGILIHKYASVYGKEFAGEASSELTCRKWHVNENLVSCLVIEAPPPQEKIKLLAEIAAEHGVEFDEAAAAADMLTGAAPPSTAAAPFPVGVGVADGPAAPYSAPSYSAPPPWATAVAAPSPAGTPPPAYPAPTAAAADGPVGGPGFAGPGAPTGPGWGPPLPPADQPGDGFPGHMNSVAAWVKYKRDGSPTKDAGQGSYTDASAAAQAARQYSTMAQQAADAAEQYAKSHGGTPPPPPTDGAAGGSGSSGGGVPGSGRFVQRSDSEIQRAYDAVPGPPSKGEILAPGPPSAPPAPPSVGAGSSAGTPPSTGAASSSNVVGARPASAGDDLGLPSAPAPPPTAAVRPPTAPAEQEEVDKELEELTRRFEALKNRR
ncbi:hypothetical protein N2152v2_009015 [Parachlorella kessleri]